MDKKIDMVMKYIKNDNLKTIYCNESLYENEVFKKIVGSRYFLNTFLNVLLSMNFVYHTSENVNKKK